MKEQRKPRSLGLIERKKQDRAARRRKNRIRATIVVCVIAVVGAAMCVEWKPWKNFSFGDLFVREEAKGDKQSGSTTGDERETIMEEAELLAMQYDYGEAIELLQTIEGYEKDKEVKGLIQDLEDQQAACVPVELDEVTHLFSHSLVVDKERTFDDEWSTTIEDFEEMLQDMYDQGYVMVSIHDLYEVTKDEDGNEKWVPADILLPEGKKAFVLSLDDVNYYHAHEDYGYASKLVLDENGDVMSEYIDAEGNVLIGAYDCVPLVDQFIKAHPDASYKGAKGIISVTGYNGILGYRTDATYDLSNVYCDEEQQAWIEAHPEFDLETEQMEAKEVAEALKENGWEFASHTWGHVRVGDRSLEGIQTDTEKWKANVEPLVGETDIITFAHGQDIQETAGAYTENNEKYQYYREQGYRIFCNINTLQTETYLGDDYLRQSRRSVK